MPLINAWNGWDPLEEVWLGDCWPVEFFEHLDGEVRDNFQKISEMTREDLAVIEQFLTDWGVTVRRPKIEPNSDLYKAWNGSLIKPPICPRDYTATLGNTLYFKDHDFYDANRRPSTWQHWVDYYRSQGESVVEPQRVITTANIVRLGRDIIWDDVFPKIYYSPEFDRKERMQMRYFRYRNFEERVNDLFSKYRIHYTNNGGHADACLATLREGLILGTDYWPFYEQTFPGWEKIMITSKPEWAEHFKGNYWVNREEFKWFVPSDQEELSNTFNSYVEEYASDWIGNYRETYFEVNVLVLDSNNIMCIGENPALFKEFQKHGITPHVVPFRTRSFWDGGLHCITNDIRRRGDCKDYWPYRGPVGRGLNIDHKYRWDEAYREKFDSEQIKSKN